MSRQGHFLSVGGQDTGDVRPNFLHPQSHFVSLCLMTRLSQTQGIIAFSNPVPFFDKYKLSRWTPGRKVEWGVCCGIEIRETSDKSITGKCVLLCFIKSILRNLCCERPKSQNYDGF